MNHMSIITVQLKCQILCRVVWDQCQPEFEALKYEPQRMPNSTFSNPLILDLATILMPFFLQILKSKIDLFEFCMHDLLMQESIYIHPYIFRGEGMGREALPNCISNLDGQRE